MIQDPTGQGELPNAKAEESVVIGAIMVNPALIDQASALSLSDFYWPRNRDAFESLLSLHKAGEELSPPSIHYHARESGKTVLVSDLSAMVSGAAGIRSIAPQVRVIKETATKRRIVKLAAVLNAGAMNGKSSQDLITTAELQFAELKSEQPNRDPRFAFTPLDDLLAEPKETTAFVVDRMLPRGGFSIMAGKPKAGKSTAARQLALSVSRGEAFLGRACDKGKAMYLCLEEKRSEIAAHFRRMGANGQDILIHTGSSPADALSALDSAIEEHSPALVIIDPLSRFVRMVDFNSYAEATRQLEPLIDMARLSKCQTHIMALHHNGKNGERESGDALLGSTGFFGAVDALLSVKKREKARTIESIQRYGEDLPETIIHLDSETGVVSGCGDLKEFTLNERKQAVLDSIGSDPIPETAIKEMISGSSGLTSKAVRALFDEGKLVRTGGGKKGDPFLYSRPARNFPDEMVIPATVFNDEESIGRCLDAQRI